MQEKLIRYNKFHKLIIRLQERVSMKLKLHNILIALFALSGVGVVVVATNWLVALTEMGFPVAISVIFGNLMAIDALFYFLVAWGLYKKTKWAFTMGLILVSINILALIFDDFGIIDALAAFFTLLLGILLLIDKKGIIKNR